jgi:5'-methylthioadenosine phosphorylase
VFLTLKTLLLILGTGLYDLYAMNKRKETRTIKTKFGEAKVVTLERDFEANHTPLAVYILFRHGLKHSVPPHLINYRANIAAAKELNVDYIVATSSVGSLNPKIGIGEYVVLDQFIDMTKSRPFTFFQEEGERFAHTDMTEPYSRIVRAAMIKSLKKNRMRGFHERGTYVCTEGPRFETPAEIRMYRRAGGDVVGMTGVPEVVLAKEIGIEYGSLGIVTNMAAGLQRSISQEEVVKQMNRSLGRTNKILDDTVRELLLR